MRVVLYCRASAGKLAEQAVALTAEARQRGWEVVGVFAEKEEGNIGLKAALAAIHEDRADLLLVTRLDDLVTRLGRLDVPIVSLGELRGTPRLVKLDGRRGGLRRRSRRLRLVR